MTSGGPGPSDPLPTFGGGRYVAMRVLGEGAQATTYEGVDKREGRPVAIKRFVVRGAKSWKEVELAEREARVLASLSHPLLPRYVDHFEEDGELFLVTEKIEGESLASIRARGAVLDEAEVVRLLRDAADALEYLHRRAPPVIHRDLKPSNVIRRPDGRFALIDFGSVRARLEPKGGSTVVGTFGFMAPEQFQGRAMPASDVYGIGATALSVLTGREPEELPHRGLAIDVAAALGRRVSPALVRVLAAMLEPDPDRRPSQIGPLLGDLDSGKEGGAAASDPRGRRQRREDRRAAKRQRKEAKRPTRRSHQSERFIARGPGIGGPVLMLLLVGLAVAQIVVRIALQVFVPVLLTMLSTVFGRDLRRAAARVSGAGKRAANAMRRARAFVKGETGRRVDAQASSPASARFRVADFEVEAAWGRVKVEDSANEPENESEREHESESKSESEEGESRGRRHRV